LSTGNQKWFPGILVAIYFGEYCIYIYCTCNCGRLHGHTYIVIGFWSTLYLIQNLCLWF